MLNKQMLMNAASKFISPQKVQTLSEAFDFASNLMNAANNPEEVFQKAGINRQNIETMKSLLNNRMSGFFLNLVGGNKEDLLKGLSAAESYLATRGLDRNVGQGAPNNSPVEQTPASELDKLRQELSRLKTKV